MRPHTKKTPGILTILVAMILLCAIFPSGVFALDSYTSSATLTFTDSGIEETAAGSGYKVSGKTLTIQSSGVYTVTGSCAEGNIVVKKGTTGVVLILDDLTLSCSTTAPIACNKTTEVTIFATGTNVIADLEDPANETSDDAGLADAFEGAVIKVKSGASLTIEGDGSLTADGSSCKNGIKGGATAEITVDMDGSLVIAAANNGLASDGEVVIESGTIDIIAGNEGIKSEPDEDDTGSAGTITIHGGTISIDTQTLSGGDGIQGANGILISGGTFDIDAYNDGIQSNADLTITGGTFDITACGGSDSKVFDADTLSAKGLKASASDEETEEATNLILISGGTFILNTADDAVHSDGSVIITGGTFDIQTGDDGVHADTSLTMGSEGGLERDPYIFIRSSYEGLEAGNLYFYSGTYYVYATDDGINAAGGSSSGSDPGQGGGNHFNPGGPGGSGGMGGPGDQTSTGDYSINIYGGSFYVNAEGDGLDSNGNISISGGLVEVWGMRTGGDNEPLDYDGTLSVTGGTVFAAGGMGMGMASPSGGSQTYRNFTTSVSSGRTITIKDGSGNVVYSTKSPKNISYIFFSTEGMTSSWTVSSGTGSVSCVCSNAFAHSWDSGEITVEEAGDTGVVTYTCTVCGALSRQTISASAGEEVITSGATGTLGDDDEISYTYTQSDDNQTATVTVSGESVTESTPVLAASYDKDGRFIGLSVITSDGGTAETEADAASVVLFWVDEDGAPLGRAADAAEGTE